MAKEHPTTKKVLCIGHRGAAGYAPENTLASIQKAVELECDLVEVDVRRTKDGQLVLLHDERVDRTTNGKGAVAAMTLKDLRRLDAGGGQWIPTLEEALHATNGRVGLILELKARGIGEQTCSVVRQSGFIGSVTYASFVHADLLQVRHVVQQVATMALFKKLPRNPVQSALEAKAAQAGLRHDTATKLLVEACHNADLRVFVYTVNKPEDIKRVRSFGVDGIVSDFPDRI